MGTAPGHRGRHVKRRDVYKDSVVSQSQLRMLSFITNAYHRPFMKRTERYKNVLRMIHKLHELQDAQKWTTAQFRKAITLLDEPHPYTLHLVGE